MGGVLLSNGVQAQSTVEEYRQIDEGFRLFTEETFDGNGRTCSTCHIPEKNYTISPADIRRLGSRDRDLVFATNVPGLENPTLVRRLALFNIGPHDATEEFPEGSFRSSMTVAALDLTILDNLPPVGPPNIRLGWSGDGSPSGGFHHGNPDPDADGSIRAFANGAIAQHSPKRLERVAGVDFRFATDDELDAMKAFQEWLGRRKVDRGPGDPRAEYDLAQLLFNDPRVENGKALYMGDAAACNVCHTNGGGHLGALGPVPGVIGANALQDTGTDEERDRLSALAGINIPRDEAAPLGVDAEFNLQSIIEAPRKQAFFHLTNETDLEAAAAFYFRPPFARTGGVPGSGSPEREIIVPFAPGKLDSLADFEAQFGPNALNKLGAFIRALSAYYSLRDCERLVQESMDRLRVGVSPRLPVLHCKFALDDVSDVLRTAKVPHLYDQVTTRLRLLKIELDDAVDLAKRTGRDTSLRRVLSRIGQYKAAIARVTPPA